MDFRYSARRVTDTLWVDEEQNVPAIIGFRPGVKGFVLYVDNDEHATFVLQLRGVDQDRAQQLLDFSHGNV